MKWAAPELLESSTQTTNESDIYAYGMVMWELVSLRRPYLGLSSGAIIRKIGSGEHEVIPNDTPIELSRLIVECWSEKAESRPHCHEVLEELIRYQTSLIKPDLKLNSTTHSNMSCGSPHDPSRSQSDHIDYQFRCDHNSLHLDSTRYTDIIGKSGIEYV